ncbi:hypothetical protein BSKO_05791 [Bryopsis sp. KO-2023]|nr:hypothetical protein BSKO_05791 [Bryopsis sp. KO-2023]
MSLRRSKTVLFSFFCRYARPKEALDSEVVSAISGTKPLVVTFQREGSLILQPGQDRRGLPGRGPNMPSPGMSMSGMPSLGVGISGIPSPGKNGPGMPNPGTSSGMPVQQEIKPCDKRLWYAQSRHGSTRTLTVGAQFEDGMPGPNDEAHQMDGSTRCTMTVSWHLGVVSSKTCPCTSIVIACVCTQKEMAEKISKLKSLYHLSEQKD